MTPNPLQPAMHSRGFTLVITLVLMMLLALLAIGLLGLSSVALRTADQGMAMAEARANARLAMMLALGQLQQEMGPDRRISAPAGILDTNPTTADFECVDQARYTGVWEAAESPFAKWTLDRPSYDKKTGFRRWLVSGSEETLKNRTMATGGLRKCMNLWLDWLATQSPSTRKSQGTIGQMRNPTMDYRICSWDHLRNYESLSRSGGVVTIGSSGRPQIRCHKEQGYAGTDGEPEWNANIGADRFRGVADFVDNASGKRKSGI